MYAPRSAKTRATSLFPEPIPPVNPTRSAMEGESFGAYGKITPAKAYALGPEAGTSPERGTFLVPLDSW
jgi:hypothetical protein